MRTAGRIGAAVVALTAVTALGLQVRVTDAQTGSGDPVAVLWILARYFTVLTNFLVAVWFTAVAVHGRPVTARVAGGLTVSSLVVAIVYHAVLARLWAPAGLAWWADQGLHSAVPALVTLWWLGFAPTRGLGPAALGTWLAWPLLYLVYAMARQVATGIAPYPFLDPALHGWTGVAGNAAAVLLLFVALGAGLIGLARLIGPRG